jgi:signal transduction histidine kinase
MPRSLRIPVAPTVWIGVVQTAWTVTLVAWIIFFVSWRTRRPEAGWTPLVVGIGLLALLLSAAIVVVIHFSRQVAHNQAMKDFVSQVSHDLRSPLATVKLHLETLKLRELDPTQREECLSMALVELGRLESGIEGVLTASRIERSALRLDLGPLELKPFLDGYASFKKREIEPMGAALSWEAERAPALVARADAAALRRLLDNLVDNAVRHCQRGVQVRLELAEQARCAVLAVADDGPGLPEKEHKKVFRMFYRAPSVRRHAKGTGLGLFIVSGIAKAHGGRAWVESEGASRGCVFRVAVPLSKESVP